MLLKGKSMSWKKIESFCLDAEEKFLYAANIAGEILKIDPITFDVNSRFQGHGGTISIITSHSSLPYIATRSGGWKVSVWKQELEGELRKLFEIDTLNIHSDSNLHSKEPLEYGDQALAFHSTKPLLITRTGEDGLVEIEFDDFHYQVVSHSCAHEKFPIMTARYVVNSNKVLCGTVHGHVFLFEEGKVLKTWKLADEDIHWFEHYQGETYLIANDARCVIRFNILDEPLPFLGNQFARDDFEHITHDPVTKRTFASSFDRNIYEIDPVTCTSIRVVWQAPYKCRWIRVLKATPNILIVQCRNGGLYKIDTTKSSVISKIKETPDAIWTSERTACGKILAAGEGNRILEFSPYPINDLYQRLTAFKKLEITLDIAPNSFVKRLIFDEVHQCLILGQSDGKITFFKEREPLYTITLEAAVRDLVIDQNSIFLYVACEDGQLLKILLDEMSIVRTWKSNFPIWALSLNENKNVIAVSERMGNLVILDTHKLYPVIHESNHRYSKRMKWLNQDILLYGSEECIHKYDLSKSVSLPYIQDTGNSVEDFAWDEEHNYLVLINYNRKVILCDLHSGRVLDSVHDQFDISYGVLWLDRYGNNSYPYEFVTFGRAGMLCSYQVYEGCILRNGYMEISG